MATEQTKLPSKHFGNAHIQTMDISNLVKLQKSKSHSKEHMYWHTSFVCICNSMLMLKRCENITSNWKYHYEKCCNIRINNGPIVVQTLGKSGKHWVQVSLISLKKLNKYLHQCLQCQPVSKQNWSSLKYNFFIVLSIGSITSKLPVLLPLIRKALPFIGRTVIVWCPLWCHSLKSLWDGSAHRCLCKHWDFSINHLAQTFDLLVGFKYHISDCYSDTFAWCS